MSNERRENQQWTSALETGAWRQALGANRHIASFIGLAGDRNPIKAGSGEAVGVPLRDGFSPRKPKAKFLGGSFLSGSFPDNQPAQRIVDAIAEDALDALANCLLKLGS